MNASNAVAGADAAFLRQSASLSAWGEALPSQAWALSSVLPRWTVRDLLAHLVIVHESLLNTLVTASDEPPIPLGEYVSTYSAHAEELERAAQDRAADTTPDALLERLASLRARVAGPLAGGAPGVLASARGPVSRVDFLRTRVLEVTVHCDDLARSIPGIPGPIIDPEALAVTVGVLLEAWAQQRPGEGQEVVVAGVGAVRVSGSGRYELDALDALRLFTGRRAPESLDATRTDPTWGPVLA